MTNNNKNNVYFRNQHGYKGDIVFISKYFLIEKMKRGRTGVLYVTEDEEIYVWDMDKNIFKKISPKDDATQTDKDVLTDIKEIFYVIKDNPPFGDIGLKLGDSSDIEIDISTNTVKVTLKDGQVIDATQNFYVTGDVSHGTNDKPISIFYNGVLLKNIGVSDKKIKTMFPFDHFWHRDKIVVRYVTIKK